jgi:F-type H+-transporting ATPase subunit b
MFCKSSIAAGAPWQWRSAMLALVFLLALPTLALASEAAGAAEGHAAKPGLLDWDIGTAFWSIIVFVLLLVVLRSFAWKPILSGLNRREAFIRDSLESARKEHEQAQQVLADYSAKLAKARQEATAIIDESRRDAEELKKRIMAEAKAEAEAIAQRSKKEIGMARDDAVKQLHDQTILLATAIAGKIVRRQLAPGDHQALMNEALTDLSKLN